MPQFTVDNTEALFGADDAENEDATRFQQYFYRNRAYESLTADQSVRVLVGHKGVGKSALLKHAFLTDLADRTPTVWVRPNDLVQAKRAAAAENDFILMVEAWKKGLLLSVLQLHWISTYGDDASSVIKDVEELQPRGLSKLLVQSITETGQKGPINIYIDDIDRGWSASPNDVTRLNGM